MAGRKFITKHSNSAITMDNAPYHSRKSIKVPCASNNITEICEWLDKNGIPHPLKDNIMKADDSGIHDKFAVEEICERHDQTVIRLPPYHCHRNAIEMGWSKVKSHLRGEQVTSIANEAEERIRETVDRVTKEDWTKYCNHIDKESANLIENEIILRKYRIL